jgi:hypothetical protein
MIQIKRILVFIFILAFLFGATTHFSYAQLTAFGGLEIFALPCTCEAGLVAWHFFTPLFLNSQIPLAGALTGPWVTAYPNFTLNPGSYALGTYAPGAGVCLIGIEPFCYTLPNYGYILPMTGTSL